MEFKGGQTNNPASSGATHPSAPRFADNGGMGMGEYHKKKTMMMLVCGIIVVAVVVLGLLGAWMWQNSKGAQTQVNTNQYQAIFLTNGQVYFGKLNNVDNRYVTITDIYYLQVQQSVQPADSKNSNAQPQVSLAKLGNELHGPEDKMVVNRDQVLFWENLKDDGKVVTAIHQNQKK